MKFFAATSGVIAEHLESLSSRADEVQNAMNHYHIFFFY
jgi:hypothetical protein